MSRRKAFVWVLLCSAISIIWGYSIEHAKPAGLDDFRAVYYGARAVIDHRNPYLPSEFQRTYQDNGGAYPTGARERAALTRAVFVCVNPPSTLFLVAPLAFLSWTPAHLLWMILVPGILILATWMTLDLVDDAALGVVCPLACILVANCQVLFQLGNTSGIAVGLCVAAVWCFFKERNIAVGVFCLAISLALKPHEVGLIWFFFLLTGGVHRKRALQALGIAALVVLPSVLWISHVAPHWLHDWHENMALSSLHGAINDPGPTSIGNTQSGMTVSLQSVLSFYRDDPRFYNPVSYVLCGAMISAWVLVTLRSHRSRENAWLAIASMSALSMLPIYHREYDTKLVLLSIPAAALLYLEGGRLGRVALAVTAVGIVFTADLPVAFLLGFSRGLQFSQDDLIGKTVSVLLTRTPTLALLLVGTFYLSVYVGRVLRFRVKRTAEAEKVFGVAPLSVECISHRQL